MGNSSRKPRSESARAATVSFDTPASLARSIFSSRSVSVTRRVAQRLELGVRVPGRHRFRIGDAGAEAIHDLTELRRAPQVEVGTVVIGRLMIAVRGVVFGLL